MQLLMQPVSSVKRRYKRCNHTYVVDGKNCEDEGDVNEKPDYAAVIEAYRPQQGSSSGENI